MRNKTFLIVATIFFYSLGSSYRLYAQQKKSNKKQPPNIIFLLTDDQTQDAVGAYGNKIVKTPNMDDLAKGGTLFKNAFVTTSLCAVSRASILSGKYARRLNFWGFGTFFSHDQLAHTYPMILGQNGYYTGFIGKWGVGDSKKNKRAGGGKSITGKEVMKLLASKFDYWYAWTGQGHYTHKLSNGKTIHLTHIVNNKAKQFLSHAPADQPFCLSISFKAPHVQDGKKARIPEPELMDLYKDVTIPKPKTDKPKYFNMLPEFLQKTENRTRWEQYFHHYKGHKHSYQKSMKDYYRLITGVDRVIGNIRKQLKEMGVADNTIIIFMGDNGLFEGRHGLAGKWYGYRSSVRVPMIIYDPLVPDSARGQRRDNMALNVDIAPTILDLAGIDIPGQMQGRSLAPLLEGKHPQWRNDFLYEHLWNTPNWAIPMSQGVISKRYTYLQYLDSNYKVFYEQLFDKKKDPHEIDNLARDPEYFNVLEMLRNRMHGLIEAKK